MNDLPRATVPVQLRFGDTDKLGHVNNAVYASYAELGRLEFLRSLGIEAPTLILARLAIDFRRQVMLGDECFVSTSVVRVGTSSIVLAQTLTANGELAAEFEAVLVWFDYAAQRPARVPDDARARLTGRVSAVTDPAGPAGPDGTSEAGTDRAAASGDEPQAR